VNLLTVSFGFAAGWTAPALLVLSSDDSPLPSGKLTEQEISNVAAIFNLGAFFGNFVHAYLADRYEDAFERFYWVFKLDSIFF
jgi:MFS family permease